MLNKTPISLKGLTLPELENFVLDMGWEKFRAKQIFKWIYNKQVDDFAQMTDIPKHYREELSQIAQINELKLLTFEKSNCDGTIKFLFELKDGEKIESVLIPDESRLTLCISTQVGCPIDCKFCATGAMGFKRNLTAGEIIDQVIQAQKYSERRITNIVFMGMGEPLLNLKNLIKAIDIITSDNGIRIGARKITVSTVGIPDKIKELADAGRKVKIALSLHTLDENLRSKLIPIASRYPISSLLEALRYYYKKVGLRITYEYIVFDGLNDRDEDVKNLVELAKMIPCKINLLKFHPVDFIRKDPILKILKPSRRLEEFAQKLRENNLTVFVRSNAGEDIKAACGQLAILNQ
ncbi:23S rRNA (adenine2503-C2)-methyltransferase [Candidatus Kryptobacter tengchongensis]|uniref:Probable dual-specificity RNA methyltransferase RlmN n=1 Tax=Kryptobacter tengchongensis TaxID=1643429 RepID=A0A656D275_KRYT1|nr:23S rRNA (adenine(2503)-C(2))-methyltransferase RlmN [Candidatus Kryptobacter tengchongensis]CUS97539.1 23S rRNA (adenine2503-C2)-methyltransferase [Candidatus Kryptobacter tengchongensis]CUU09656.1 23S rRNA (adenine2503-C2)-methyltransferase [Candidatus Kryptobacter tengchongensis]CUU10190.1 23S rRNA (adenine2503-C2)-methyltransferase [Candidatus Kryptobacter tengchongensis]